MQEMQIQKKKKKKEIQVPSLGQEYPLEKEMATHCSISCLENSMDRGAWQATVQGVTKSQTTEHAHATVFHCVHNTSYLSVHLLMDTEVASVSCCLVLAIK